MLRHMKFAMLALLLASSFFMMGVIEGGDIPEYIRKQAHSEKECGVRTIKDGNVADIFKLQDNPEYAKILCIQTSPEVMNAEYAGIIMKWVRESGHTVWFYDSRLAGWFGMEASDINPEGAFSKEITGEYGGRKVKGKAAVVSAFGNHKTLSGVNGAVVFLVPTGENTYSAVKCSGVTPLLKQNLASDQAVSAIREEGSGRIILKPLLWPDKIDGLRFQTNIMEFSAGYPVPVVTEKDSPITDEMMVPSKSSDKWEEIDEVELSDGRTVWGRVNNGEFVFEGISKGKKIKKDEIKTIVFSEKGSGLDAVIFENGKSQKGLLSLSVDGLVFKTPCGKTVRIGKKEIKKISFGLSKERDAVK